MTDHHWWVLSPQHIDCHSLAKNSVKTDEHQPSAAAAFVALVKAAWRREGFHHRAQRARQLAPSSGCHHGSHLDCCFEFVTSAL